MVTSSSSDAVPIDHAAEARRRLPAAQRRALIENAAARLFAERGYVATTVEDIVAAAGVSKPMLYRHFESKKELQIKLLERRRDELAAAALDSFLQGEGEPGRRLPAMIDAWFAHVERHPHTSRILFQDAIGDPDIQELQRDLRDRQRAADVALLREFAPELPERELEPLGEIIRSSLTGLALWWLDNLEVPRGTPVAAILRVTTSVLTSVGAQVAG
ncbi:MAG TPA: TetR/AcrR family transcriptional regulator [Solirubrobacteraceae bacterium]|jgi:AcrR family transcriptional regulator|nr:TetR/AcrR family transcriptional regulator [Solirubrobacteraceae bacterium]